MLATLTLALALVIGTIVVDGSTGYEGQPGNQGGGSGQAGYEGQPGNQGGGGGNGQLGYEGQPGNQGGR